MRAVSVGSNSIGTEILAEALPCAGGTLDIVTGSMRGIG